MQHWAEMSLKNLKLLFVFLLFFSFCRGTEKRQLAIFYFLVKPVK